MQAIVDLLPHWGPWILGLSAFLSCMMIPLPTSFLLVTAGALTGTGHLYLPELVLGATLGATAGDLSAFLLARRIGPWLAQSGTNRAAVMARAGQFISKRGVLAVFLSRWMITPLGPATNYVAGAAGLPLHRFAAASAAGELIWAVLHLVLGHAFARDFRGHETAFAKAIVVGLILAAILWAARIVWRKRGKPVI